MSVTIMRRIRFCAGHRLHRHGGKCENFHGHNYELIVKLVGEPDPQTGYVMDMKVLSELVKEHVLLRFDHKNLNLDTTYFKDINPTAENICVVIYNILRDKIDARLDMQVRLYETERNFVEYPAT